MGEKKKGRPMMYAFASTRFLMCSMAMLPMAAQAQQDSRAWDGEVRVHGALRAMMHEGKTGATVTLDMILPNRDLYALGALADLSGEVTVVGGKVYLSYPKGAEETRTETTSETSAGATLLVAAEVPAWQSVRVEKPIPGTRILLGLRGHG